MPPALKLSPLAWTLLITLSVIWGGSFLFARIAVLEIPPFTLVFLRVFLAAIVLNLVLVLRSHPLANAPGLWLSFAIMGLLNNILPFTFIFYGQTEIGAGLAAIINAMTPIWTVVFAHFATRDEKITRSKILGMALSFAGVAVLIGIAALEGLAGSALAQLSVLAATISYGLAGVFGKRFANVPPIETARGQLTCSSFIILPVVLLVDQPWTLPMPSTQALFSVIALAVVCTALAYILFFKILSMAGAVNVALVTFLIPPSAILLGVFILYETLTLNQITGMLLILAGLLVIDGRLFKRAEREKAPR